jgi:hypothetical protein
LRSKFVWFRVGGVSAVFAYRGREVGTQDIEFIRGLIAAHPGLSRRRLSAKLCQAWNWVQPNGQLRDMVARSLMLELHRAGHIQLPAQRFCPVNNVARHRAPEPDLALAWAPLECSLAALGSLEIRQVRRSPAEVLFNRLMQTHHYLGYTQPVGDYAQMPIMRSCGLN